MDTLVTAFEPWGDRLTNPTIAVARALEGERVRGGRVRVRILPVDFFRAPAILAEAWGCIRPRAVLALGLAEGRATLDLERIAWNRRVKPGGGSGEGTADAWVPLVVGAPARLETPLAVELLVRALRADGFPVAMSEDAGRFVCNAVLYHMVLKRLASPDAPAVCFVHMPWTTRSPRADLDRPGAGDPLPFGMVVEAVRRLVYRL